MREQQEIALTSAGLYDTQTLTVAVNMSAVDNNAPPSVVLEWGGRSTDAIPVTQLEENAGTCVMYACHCGPNIYV